VLTVLVPTSIFGTRALRLLSIAVLGGWLTPPGAWGQTPAAEPPALPRPVTEASSASPSWLTVGAQYRFRFENRTGTGFRENSSDNYGLGRLLVDVGIKPSSHLEFHFQGQDARAPGKKNANGVFRDPFDVRQAWVQIGATEKGWIRARVGRQELKYGSQRLVGPLDWLNTARQFDAVKVNIGEKDLNVDFFASSVVVIDPGDFNKHRDGNNLHGAYANLSRFGGGGTLETYALWKTTTVVIGSGGRAGDADLLTTGFHYKRQVDGGFDLETELATQTGTFARDDISAWGTYGILGYTPAGMTLSPRFSVEYQYASGDDDPNDSTMGTFDQLFPTGHLYQGTADRIGWRNISDVRAGMQFKPHPKLASSIDYFSFWLANRNDGLYAVNGRLSVAAPEGGAQNSHVGQEIDWTFVWKPAPHVALGGGLGYFASGQFLKETSPGHRHTFSYLFLNYVL